MQINSRRNGARNSGANTRSQSLQTPNREQIARATRLGTPNEVITSYQRTDGHYAYILRGVHRENVQRGDVPRHGIVHIEAGHSDLLNQFSHPSLVQRVNQAAGHHDKVRAREARNQSAALNMANDFLRQPPICGSYDNSPRNNAIQSYAIHSPQSGTTICRPIRVDYSRSPNQFQAPGYPSGFTVMSMRFNG